MWVSMFRVRVGMDIKGCCVVGCVSRTYLFVATHHDIYIFPKEFVE